MNTHPFSIFEPFHDLLSITLFTKEDRINSDEQVAERLGFPTYAGLRQVHGNRTVVLREPLHSEEQADGMITDHKGLLLLARAADCQAFVIAAPERKVVGTLHAGWRGINAGAIPSFYETLKEEWGIGPEETFVGAAPSLCRKCAGFTNPKEELPNVSSALFEGTHVDLQAAANAQFRELGIREEQFERHPDCTCCNPETYWTYRGGDREKVKEGWRNVLACVLL